MKIILKILVTQSIKKVTEPAMNAAELKICIIKWKQYRHIKPVDSMRHNSITPLLYNLANYQKMQPTKSAEKCTASRHTPELDDCWVDLDGRQGNPEGLTQLHHADENQQTQWMNGSAEILTGALTDRVRNNEKNYSEISLITGE